MATGDLLQQLADDMHEVKTALLGGLDGQQRGLIMRVGALEDLMMQHEAQHTQHRKDFGEVRGEIKAMTEKRTEGLNGWLMLLANILISVAVSAIVTWKGGHL